MLKVIDGGAESYQAGAAAGVARSPIDEIVREGARRMLAAALQAEVAAYIEQFADELDADGRRLVVRNGYHNEREVMNELRRGCCARTQGERQACRSGNR
jgi:putative transposase